MGRPYTQKVLIYRIVAALFLLHTQQYIVTLIWILIRLESLVWSGPISTSLEPALTCPLLDTLQIPFKHAHRQGVPSAQTNSSPLSYISQRYTYVRVLTARNPCIATWLQVPFTTVSLNKTTSLIHKNDFFFLKKKHVCCKYFTFIILHETALYRLYLTYSKIKNVR